ncbi:DUF2975 domain-containing protein [Glycomyces sp. NPDC046736]|uniref:DUF2975 domain-containing protein n=1 Tax=Glycomyces sp. NPDC046736 TaxID=3155615 RepID=UPI003400C72C
MHSIMILFLRMAIAGAFLAGLFGQFVVLPTTFTDSIPVNDGFQVSMLLYTIAGILGIACVQVVLVAAWVLLGMIERDAIFSIRSFRWVNVIIWATLVATGLSFAVTVHLLFVDIPVDEMTTIGMFGSMALCTGTGAVIAMLLVIMRGLLRKATLLQSEMSEVI